MKKVKNTLIAVALLFVGILLVGCSSGTVGQSETTVTSAVPKGVEAPAAKVGAPAAKVGASVGDAAPNFRLTRTDGSAVSLDDLRGSPAVLVFWTAWCPACKEEAPHVNELAAEYGPRGVRVLGINIKDSEARTAGGIKEFDIRYPVARDADADAARSYKVKGIPAIFFLDREGVVRYFGNQLPADYASRLDALLTQKG